MRVQFGSIARFAPLLGSLFEEQEPTAREIAEFMLNQAISLDQGQPADDMSVVVLQTTRESKRIRLNILRSGCQFNNNYGIIKTEHNQSFFYLLT